MSAAQSHVQGECDALEACAHRGGDGGVETRGAHCASEREIEFVSRLRELLALWQRRAQRATCTFALEASTSGTREEMVCF